MLNVQDKILVTGAGGFIGRRVVGSLLSHGVTNVACVVRPARQSLSANEFGGECDPHCVDVLSGNLLSREDCLRVSRDAQVVLHLATGRGEKSYPDAYLNSVVTTRNLLEACRQHRCLKRFVNVSSFAVYCTQPSYRNGLLDETCPLDAQPHLRGQAYCYAKVRQDELVQEYGRKHGLPYVLVRPGWVYGPGNEPIHSRVGIGTFGLFLHLGGSNRLPLSYVDNCAEAIVLAGTVKDVDGEVFNIVDDDLPTSRQFLRDYKREVKRFRSVYLPHGFSYLACLLWEKYSAWSQGQLPPVFGRGTWYANWKKTAYSNAKLKQRLGWKQPVPTGEGLRRYFAACREKEAAAQ